MNGRIVAHYRIEELAGEGGAGRVYRAHDTGLDRPVALKFLRPELAADPAVLERFLQEARLAATLDDKHICTVHAIDRDAEGAWYIAMSWYDGGTLERRLADGAIAPDQALDWARQTALGLAEAHRRGVVHRDIKPANLILDDRGQIRILDFGIARLQDSGRRTRAGTLTGTVAYMAPEQARGEEGGAAADIWATGVVLHQMLTGRLPFTGAYEAALLFDIVHGTPPPLPARLAALREPCQAILDRCLAKDPRDRYGSAGELAAELRAVLGGDNPRRRHRLMRAAVAALLVLAAAFAGLRYGPDLGRFLAAREAARGVAVLPLVFAEGPDGDGAALGAGYGWYLADRLSRLEHRTRAFWVVPPGEVERYDVDSEGQALDIFGTRRVLSGRGSLQGRTLTLELSYHDGTSGRHAAQRFSDDLANLRTWQQEVPAWAAGVLDERFLGTSPPEFAAGSTTVPAAWRAWLAGAGIVWNGDAVADSAGFARGIARLAEAVAQDSSFTDARTDWCWASYRQARRRDRDAEVQALAALADVRRRDPRAIWPLAYAAGRARAAGEHDLAISLSERILAVDPASHAGLVGLAEALAAADRGDEAAEAYDRALRQRPGYGPLLIEAARFWYFRPDYRRAADLAGEAVAATPGNYLAHILLGAARFELDDYPAAAAAFEQSLVCKPTHLAHQNLGTIAYYDGRLADAAREYGLALKLKESHEGWKHLGEAWRWLEGYADSSRAAYGHAVELAEVQLADRPADWELMAVLATYHSARGDLAEAADLVDRLEEAAPELGCDGMFHLAVANEDLGRRDRALDWLEEAFRCGLPPERPQRYLGFRNLRADPRYREVAARFAKAS